VCTGIPNEPAALGPRCRRRVVTRLLRGLLWNAAGKPCRSARLCTLSQRLQPKSNNNEAINGLALFCTGLTLETYVTGAKYPVKCTASCGEATYGWRNPPKRRTVPYGC